MAMLDRDDNRRGAKDVAERPPFFLRYPEDQIDFGYEIAGSAFDGMGRRPGPEGLSLAARVYE
ncbi:hypothetical protein FNJ84_05975 [Paracoccus sp. M683]|uniref:hypothetical protein n=1 Tax=Paracoccus sp. M683 TaxID=2594268 RepID=UPI00117E75D5|nr:hypothetical protein [Paracoccus sp. M683]TRW98324.1 hypothetical protein FNJ84_05975 [Paracoccus sp. M683]